MLFGLLLFTSVHSSGSGAAPPEFSLKSWVGDGVEKLQGVEVKRARPHAANILLVSILWWYFEHEK